MKYNSAIPHRRSLRLKGYDYSWSGAYFITTCVHRQEHLFGEIETGRMVINTNGDIVARIWCDLVNHFSNIVLDAFIVMPNHFHGIIIITGDGMGAIHELPPYRHRRNMLLSKIMGRFKMVSAKQINISRKTAGKAVWQRNYWEHVVRNEEEFSQIRHYIKNNPVMWEQDKLNNGTGNTVLETQTVYGEKPWMS